MDAETLLAFGGAIKAVGDDGKVEGYLVRFTDADSPDLEGQYFTKDTDFDASAGDRLTAYYHHGMDSHLKNRKLGKGIIERIDEVGIWIRAQLDLRDEYERAVYKLVKAGKAGWSSTALPHLVVLERTGKSEFIKSWPLGKDATITPTPAAGPELTQVISYKSWQDANPSHEALIPEGASTAPADSAGAREPAATTQYEDTDMSDILSRSDMDAAIKAALVAEREQRVADEAAAHEKAEREQAIAAEAIKKYKEANPERIGNDSGFASGVNFAKNADVWKYDNYVAADLAMTLEVVGTQTGKTARQLSPVMVKALAMRLESAEANDEGQLPTGGGRYAKTRGPLAVASSAMKASGIKADETNFSTNSTFGDEWIGVAYSGQLWEQVRVADPVLQRMPTFEFPAGAESMVIPLESTDPVWYLVAQAGDPPTSNLTPIANTVPAKALGTGNKSMTLGKLGSSTIYTGEMNEDAFVMYAQQLRNQIALSGGEYLTSAIIDGDVATTASTNINDIAGTPGSTDYFLIWNGLRKSGLVTTTANSRSAGTLTAADFLETVKLMGASGKVAFDKRMTSFILSPPVHWTALQLPEVKTRDVNANPTVEDGALVRIYGYDVVTSYNYNRPSLVNTAYEYLEESSGKVDVDTGSDNTLGSFLAVRWDYWKLGFRRRLTTEVERIPRADAWEITSLMRAGLVQRDTEASAISYNVTV